MNASPTWWAALDACRPEITRIVEHLLPKYAPRFTTAFDAREIGPLIDIMHAAWLVSPATVAIEDMPGFAKMATLLDETHIDPPVGRANNREHTRPRR